MQQPDMLIIFPPQWSPFQPFLSLPSLKAFLSSKGLSIEQRDWNVDFYEYFISPKRRLEAWGRLENFLATLTPTHEAYKNQVLFSLGILKKHNENLRLVERLRSRECVQDVEDFYECVIAFKRLLHAFSVAEPVVDIGSSSFSASNVMQSLEEIERFCVDRTCNPFIAFFESKIGELRAKPRYFGISVIGTEQLLPSLTLGRMLKSAFPDVPVVVGGSVFSRLVERTERIAPLLGRYLDIVCRYEGEAPMAAFLEATDPLRERTPGIAFSESGRIVTTPLATQLSMAQIPTPDFDGLDLRKYFTPDIVLPVLSTRGCYWDKCAFCYHGMIYGDRYRMRSPDQFAEDIDTLHRKYGARHFALNDEAIPPKLFEKLPAVLPKNRYFFTGLYKFEKFFKPEHFQGMHDIGFRSLYIGLESASERVQSHMRKNNTRDVMISNLTDAHAAGIWNHTFNFFGFPTETHEEAEETMNFLIDHSDVIHSEGTGTFSFEHNAPIYKRPADFGVSRIIEKNDNVLELYYDYETESGLSAAEASDMVKLFGDKKRQTNAFQYGGWIPREQLLVLLSYHSRAALRSALDKLESAPRSGVRRRLSWFCTGQAPNLQYFIVDALSGRVFETNKDGAILLEFFPSNFDSKDAEDTAFLDCFPGLSEVFARGSKTARLAAESAA